MTKKKTLCWFSHKHTDIVGFTLISRGGKMTSVPRHQSIAFAIQCKYCLHVTEVYYKTVDSNIAKAEVARLNESIGEKYDAHATYSAINYKSYKSSW